MDLLFKRYASPFLLLDNYIISGMLVEFIDEFIDITNEETVYELWLHKEYKKNYQEFKAQFIKEKAKVDDSKVETVINDSFNILNNFIPKEGG